MLSKETMFKNKFEFLQKHVFIVPSSNTLFKNVQKIKRLQNLPVGLIYCTH